MVRTADRIDVISYILPHLTKEILSATNENGSPAIHWAILNNHVNCVKALVELPEEQGGGIQLLKVRHPMYCGLCSQSANESSGT